MHAVRTDLALEMLEIAEEQAGKLSGIHSEEETVLGSRVTRVEILDTEGEKLLSKKRGNYITIESRAMGESDDVLRRKVGKVVSEELNRLTRLRENQSVLVIGLGNRHVTPDALGPSVSEKVLVTRHLYSEKLLEKDSRVRAVSALTPGVLGLTGIETGEIVKGVVERTKPDLVIAIDALASRRMERVCTTIQISDTGIHPGSGVGNKRKVLSEETLGVKVIAIGVPTVVDAPTIANDALDMLLDTMLQETGENAPFFNALSKLNRDEKYQMLKNLFAPQELSTIVTPRDIDAMILRISDVVSDGINRCLHGDDSVSHI